MQKQSINVPLAAEDVRALVALASEHCRHPREELRYLLREEARRRGLLEQERTSQDCKQQAEVKE